MFVETSKSFLRHDITNKKRRSKILQESKYWIEDTFVEQESISHQFSNIIEQNNN